MKKLLIACLGFLGLYLYLNSSSVSVEAPADHIAPSVYEQPEQKKVSGKSIPFHRGKLNLLAEYKLTARILDIGHYRRDKEASIAPMDLTLGWGKMSEEAVFKRLNVRNTRRWYKYNWSGAPPIPKKEIIRSSANVHIVPASDEILRTLKELKKYQFVTLEGRLVHYREDYSDGGWWEWKSSMTRRDQGDGSCEIMYVQRVIAH